MIPGGVRILSPTLTRARPPAITPLLARGPMGNTYGKPQTELIIRHRDPVVASGIPLAVIVGGIMKSTMPVSGGPDAPGLIVTVQPMVTGEPGILPHPGEKDVNPLSETDVPRRVAERPPSTVAPMFPLRVA